MKLKLSRNKVIISSLITHSIIFFSKKFRFTLLLIIIIFGQYSFAQNHKLIFNNKEILLDDRLVNHFDFGYLEKLKSESPNLLVYLNFYVKNSYKIIDAGEKAKKDNYKLLSEYSLTSKNTQEIQRSNNLDNFNILSYEVNLLDSQQVISLEQNNLVLIIDSKQEFLEKYNKYINSIK
jgi:hypothetical protein